MRGRNWLTLEMLEFGSVNVFWDLWSDSLEAIYLIRKEQRGLNSIERQTTVRFWGPDAEIEYRHCCLVRLFRL